MDCTLDFIRRASLCQCVGTVHSGRPGRTLSPRPRETWKTSRYSKISDHSSRNISVPQSFSSLIHDSSLRLSALPTSTLSTHTHSMEAQWLARRKPPWSPNWSVRVSPHLSSQELSQVFTERSRLSCEDVLAKTIRTDRSIEVFAPGPSCHPVPLLLLGSPATTSRGAGCRTRQRTRVQLVVLSFESQGLRVEQKIWKIVCSIQACPHPQERGLSAPQRGLGRGMKGNRGLSGCVPVCVLSREREGRVRTLRETWRSGGRGRCVPASRAQERVQACSPGKGSGFCSNGFGKPGGQSRAKI